MTRTNTMIAFGSALALSLVMTLPALAGGGSRTRLEARLESATSLASGKARFESRRGRQRFSVQIEDAAANATHTVTVDGVDVGTIRTGGTGGGDLDFDSNFEPGLDDPATQFPADFPIIGAGTSVVVTGGGDAIEGALGSK